MDYAKGQALNTRARGLLTRAEKSTDTKYRLAKIDQVTDLYDEMGPWPDEWHRLQRLIDDTKMMVLEEEW